MGTTPLCTQRDIHSASSNSGSFSRDSFSPGTPINVILKERTRLRNAGADDSASTVDKESRSPLFGAVKKVTPVPPFPTGKRKLVDVDEPGSCTGNSIKKGSRGSKDDASSKGGEGS